MSENLDNIFNKPLEQIDDLIAEVKNLKNKVRKEVYPKNEWIKEDALVGDGWRR